MKIKTFDYSEESINGIEGNPFIDFSSFLNFDFETLDEELCRFMAKNPPTKLPMVSGSVPKDFAGIKFESEVLTGLDDKNRKEINNMSHNEARRYLLFKHKSFVPWAFILDLKPSSFLDKNIDNTPWSDFMDELPYTRKSIETLPFDEIGRVVVYGSWPSAIVPCHRDTFPSKIFDHHINFNPGGYRPVYLYDCLSKEKVYLPKNNLLYAYNTSDYHGVDSLPYFSYTIRVDGRLNKTAIDHINNYKS